MSLLLGGQLDAFLQVAQSKTVHKAAEELCLTQTAVTQRIRNLENKLKASLFIRTRRGMLLTSEGERLLDYCYAATALEKDTVHAIKSMALSQEIKLCITSPSSMMSSRIIPVALDLLQDFPQLLYHFDINDLETRHISLKERHADFAVIKKEDLLPDMQSKALKPERYILVCSKKWQKRKLSDIIQNERIIDFEPNDEMTFNYLKYFNLYQQASLERHFANRIANVAMLIASGVGFGVLTKEFATPYINSGELIMMNQGKIYENSLHLAWYCRPYLPDYFQQFISRLQ